VLSGNNILQMLMAFDSTIDLVVAIVALSTECGFKVITTYFDAMSHDVYSLDGIMADNHITSEVDSTLGTCPASRYVLCALSSWRTAHSTEQMLYVGNRISSQRLILIRGNCFEHASTLIVRFINLLYSPRGCPDLAGFGISISFAEYIFILLVARLMVSPY